MKFDPEAFLEQFPPEMRKCITAAAVLFAASFEAEHRPGVLSEMALVRWLHARETALHYLQMVAHCMPDLREGPDLATVKMRACRQCGCTDQSACEGGCTWVSEDLCSACCEMHGDHVAGHA